MSETDTVDNLELFGLEARRQVEHWINSDLARRSNVREIQIFDALHELVASITTEMRGRIGADFVIVFPGAWLRPPALFGLVANARWPELSAHFWDIREIKPVRPGPYLIVAPKMIPFSAVTGSEMAKYIQVEAATSESETALATNIVAQPKIFGNRCGEDFDRLPWEVLTFEEAMAYILHRPELFFSNSDELDIRLLGSMVGLDHILGIQTWPSSFKLPKIIISAHQLITTVRACTQLLICRQRL